MNKRKTHMRIWAMSTLVACMTVAVIVSISLGSTPVFASRQTSSEVLEQFMNIFNPSSKRRLSPAPAIPPSGNTPVPDANQPTGSQPTGGSQPTIPVPTNTNPQTPIASGLLGNTNHPYSPDLVSLASKCLQNKAVYESATSGTGIPWQVLAGIHLTESGDCNPNQSLVSGRTLGTDEPDLGGVCSSQETGLGIPVYLGYSERWERNLCGFTNLLSSAIYAVKHLQRKVSYIGPLYGIPQTHEQLVFGVSAYNGGGNSNCRGGTKYTCCPEKFKREDDTYVFNKTPDGCHNVMYIRYCADRMLCVDMGKEPPIHQVPGVLTIAGILNNL